MPKLPQWIQQLSGSEESIEPDLVPGNWFVSRAFSVPEELKSKDVEEFAELSVEEISPFNLEQLYWGFHYSEESNRVFIYAAFDQKLRAQMAESELYDYVFPDFVQTFGLKFDQSTLIFLIHESTLCGILLPTNDPVPQAVVGLTLNVEFSAEELDEAKQQVTRRIQEQVARLPERTLANPVSSFDSVDVSDKIYTRNWDYQDSKSTPAIELVPYADGPGSPWLVSIPGSNRLWELDIRKAEAKEQLVKKHSWTLLLWRASVAVVLLFICLAFLEIGLVALSKMNENELLVALELEPQAENVQQKADILAKINQVTNNQLLPFEMLDAINQLRPPSIYFTRLTAEDGNALQVEAISFDITAVKEYEEELNQVGFLSLVEISNNRVQNNRATFRLRVEFKQGALQAQTFLTGL